MITTALLNIIYVFVLGIVALVSAFGDVTANNAITSSILAFKGYYLSLEQYIPLDTIVLIIAFDLAFEGIYFLYKLIKWGYKKVPTIS